MRKNQYNSGDGLQTEKMTPLRTASFILIGILIRYFGALLFIGGHRAILRDPTVLTFAIVHRGTNGKVGLLLNKRRLLKRSPAGEWWGNRGNFLSTAAATQRRAGERVSGYWRGILRGSGLPGGHSSVLHNC